jgi:NAD(P)-dependent dehydrogenase (short-subunit alcohol dehydrogenase family)
MNFPSRAPTNSICIADGRVVFVTGGAGTICSGQTRALVHLGADACIIGRNVEKTEKAARDIAQVRQGAKVVGIGGVDVRSVCNARSHVLARVFARVLMPWVPVRQPQGRRRAMRQRTGRH